MALAAACVALILAAVVQVHAVGQTLLAVLLLACGGLAVWAYTSPRTLALRYLLPGIGAAVVFVIFPMLYTVGIAFTNYSASNLLEFERAREVLLTHEPTDLPSGKLILERLSTPGFKASPHEWLGMFVTEGEDLARAGLEAGHVELRTTLGAGLKLHGDSKAGGRARPRGSCGPL